MKLLQFIPAVFAVFMIFGIVFGFYIEPSIIMVIGLLISGLLLLLISYFLSNKLVNESYHFTILSYFLFFNIGLAAVTFQNERFRKNHYSNFISKGNNTVLIIKKQLKSNTFYNKYEAKVSQINDNKTIGRILLNISKKDNIIKLNIEDKIFIKTDFKSINAPLNLYQFNYQEYLKKQQIYHQVTVNNSGIYKLRTRQFSLNSIAEQFRSTINIALKKYHFKKDELAIINALVLGQRNEVSKTLLQNYTNAGALHILAVSGLHIGILLLLLNALFSPLRYLKHGKIIQLIVVVLLLWLYALIAGFSPSIIRAVSMFTAIAFGLLSNKKTNTLNNLFISIFFLLLINPLYIFSVGFQLSYLAVFSIVYFYPLFTRFYHPKNLIFRKVWQLMSISFAAQLGILPLSLYYFHQFPSLFFISSLVIIPLLGFILGFGILIIFLAIIGILPQFLANSYGTIIHAMNWFIAFIAKQEVFIFSNIHFSIQMLIALYLILIFGYHLLYKNSFKKLVFLLLGIVCFQSVLIFEKHQLQSKNELVIFNKTKQSILSFRTGKNTTIFNSLDSITIKNEQCIVNYQVGIGSLKLKYMPLKNSYTFKETTLLVVDSLGIYKLPNYKINTILLSQSPKINLNRLIAIIKPNLIIADASNYKSYKKRWQQTCIEQQIPFYDTAVSGAYTF